MWLVRRLPALLFVPCFLYGCDRTPTVEPVEGLFLAPVEQPALAGITLTSGLASATLEGECVLLIGTHSGLPLAFTVGPNLVLRAASFLTGGTEVLDHHATVVHDFDRDGLDDLYFVTGAHRGQGSGANVLLLSTSGYAQDHAQELGVRDRFGRGRGGLALDVDAAFEDEGHDELFALNFKSALRAFEIAPGTMARDRVDEVFGLDPVDESAVQEAVERGGDGLAERARGHFVHALLPVDVAFDGAVDFVAQGGPPLQLMRNVEGRLHADFEALPSDVYLPPPAAVAAADFDGDGFCDLYLAYGDTDAPREFDRERRNRLLFWRDDRFVEDPRAESARHGYGSVVASGDLDLDGRPDLVIAQHTRATARTDLRVFLAREDGRFEEDPTNRGALTGLRGRPDALWLRDLDGDGDLDLVALLGAIEHGEGGGGVHVYRNGVEPRSWFELALVAAPGRGLYGTRVTIRAGDRTQRRTYLPTQVGGSSFAIPLHFGLGKARRIEELRIDWPDGQRTARSGLAVDSSLEIERP